MHQDEHSNENQKLNESMNTSRRKLLRAATLTGFGAITLGHSLPAAAKKRSKKPITPALTASEISAIEAAIGKKGTYVEAEGVYTVPLPRNDLKVTIKGEPVPIAFGFGGWVSFKKTVDGKGAVVMGDTVLPEGEVNPLISAAQANGFEVGAIHNHFFYEQPRIFYMHLHGMGDVADLARRYAASIQNTKAFPANQPPTGPPPARTAKEIFDLPALDAIIGATGKVNGGVYKYTLGRPDLTVMTMNAEMTPAIGLNTWAAFAGEPDAAHIAGDVAMLAPEVNPVIRALRANNIEVVAVHSHMLDEDPRILFLHYYGRGPAATLARGFRAALDQLGKPQPRMSGMKM
jgi:hypothetical protein